MPPRRSPELICRFVFGWYRNLRLIYIISNHCAISTTSLVSFFSTIYTHKTKTFVWFFCCCYICFAIRQTFIAEFGMWIWMSLRLYAFYRLSAYIIFNTPTLCIVNYYMYIISFLNPYETLYSSAWLTIYEHHHRPVQRSANSEWSKPVDIFIYI